MNDFYYSQLGKPEQVFYKRFLDAARLGAPSANSTPFMAVESAMRVVTAVGYDHPELFYVDFQRLNYIASLMGTMFRIGYQVQSSLREKVTADIEKSISDILTNAQAVGLKSDYEKSRWVHNYLVKNVRYNFDALRQPTVYPEAFTISGVFCDRLAVCEGIAKAYKLLCNRLGVEAIVVSGTSSLEGVEIDAPHAWNIVRIDGDYTHVDATWDIGASQPCKRMRFDYFCLPDKRIRIDHITASENLPHCNSDCLDYFTKTGKSFTSGKQLRAFLESEIKKGTDTLYFRVTDPRMAPGQLKEKIRKNVSEALDRYCRYPCSIEISVNESQQCYFYRLTRQR